jgi:hypothetical protein
MNCRPGKPIKERKVANTIEDFLKSRQRFPVVTNDLFKDICRRIKKLEGKK